METKTRTAVGYRDFWQTRTTNPAATGKRFFYYDGFRVCQSGTRPVTLYPVHYTMLLATKTRTGKR